MELTSGYSLVEGPPALRDYLVLRARAGLSPKTELQGEAALRGSWWAVHVRASEGLAVGMGRVIGDGGWYFHIADMAVLPEHQRRGIGDAILTALVEHIRQAAPREPYITLLADEPGRRLYTRHGFVPTAPHSIGMKLSKP
ncbi:MAG: GNAT family N-acetyltransferase [Polyangiaceae bacterium]